MSGPLTALDRPAQQADARLRRWFYGLYLAFGPLALTIFDPPAPRLLWNASASMPRGLYRVHPGTTPRRGDVVVAHLSPAMRDLAAARRYLPAGVPVVKPVAAVAGDRLCAQRRVIRVNGRHLADRLAVDPAGRALPIWQGCHVLGKGDVFLLADASPDSFDGRYFGITHRTDLVGTAELLWHR
ncbi:S26 family signal peptidase [Sphingomonas sp.]|uniref:S26 family signal peptidase n=1 Tax=Sphingomonas sp. TaxID=28214 RepID=UPI0025DA2FB8|nr:S26 family signal peptidase [Sphingomonas sp.]